MTTKSKGEENLQMSENVVTEQVSARIAWFLAGAYPGGAKRKRAARDFDVSPDTVKGWMNGSRPAGRHFDAMVRRWGEPFLRFVYPVSTARHHAEMAEIAELRGIADRIERLEETVYETMAGRDQARLASQESHPSVSTGRRGGAEDQGRDAETAPGSAASRTASAPPAPGIRAPGRDVGRPDAAPEKGQ